LGVHHSTVLRRIEALEKRLNVRLFQRHARGYAPTEAGRLLLKVAEETQHSFDTLIGQLAGTDEQLSGKIIVTSVESFAREVTAVLAEFQDKHPEVRIEYMVDMRLLKPEYGEAHVCIRPGVKPSHPDYIVQQLRCSDASLYATKEYIRNFGPMKSLEHTQGHRFISTITPLLHVPFYHWLETQVPAEQIYYRSSDLHAMLEAARAGMGIVPFNSRGAAQHEALIPMLDPVPEWETELWLVTHRDAHRTAKVQALTQLIKERMKC